MVLRNARASISEPIVVDQEAPKNRQLHCGRTVKLPTRSRIVDDVVQACDSGGSREVKRKKVRVKKRTKRRCLWKD